MHFLNQDDLINRIYASDLYVHTSEVDVEPLSCIEAFTCGKVPILAHSKKSGAPLFAITEHSLFPAKNAGALAEQIDYWIEHPKERYEYEQKYAKAGRFYKLDYSLEKFENMLNEARQDMATRRMMQDRRYRHIVKRANREPTLSKIIGWPVYYLFVIPAVFMINTLFFGLRIKNRKYLREAKRKSGAAITICNHIHEMDPTMCGLAIFPSKPIFTSQPANFKSNVGFIVGLLGSVPIPKTPRETQVFFYLLEQRLRCGKVVHFYPECSLVRYDQNLRKFQRGAFHLSVRTNVPVVPMRIVYREPAGLYKGFKRKPLMTIIFDEPLYPGEDEEGKNAIDNLKGRAFESMEKIAEKSMQECAV
jgi:1-acyl-sn-glycerol-3-phosphate acyltransferase